MCEYYDCVLLDVTPVYDGMREEMVMTIRRGDSVGYVRVRDIPHEIYIEDASPLIVSDIHNLLSKKSIGYKKCRPFCNNCIADGKAQIMELENLAIEGRRMIIKKRNITKVFADGRTNDAGDKWGVNGSRDIEDEYNDDDDDENVNGQYEDDDKNEFFSRSLCVKFQQSILRSNNVISGTSIRHALDHSHYEEIPRPFLRIQITHGDLSKMIAESWMNFDKRQRGVFNVINSACDSFMAISNLSSFEKIRFPSKRDENNNDLPSAKRLSFNQISIVNDVEERKSADFNVRVLSFDIETISVRYNTYENNRALYPIGTISVHTCTGNNEMGKKDFYWEPNGDASDAFNELQMLRDFFNYVSKIYDPDYIIGWNITGFDIPYVIKRAIVLGMQPKDALAWLPRVSGEYAHISTSVRRGRSQTNIDAPGRIILDMLDEIRKDVTIRLDDYKLATVAKHFNLKVGKLDMPYEMLHEHFYSKEKAKLMRIVEYCSQDAFLPLEIFQLTRKHLDVEANCLLLRIRAQEFVIRGQGYKIMCALRERLNQANQLMRFTMKKQMNVMHKLIPGAEDYWQRGSYGGGFVKQPIVGLYKKPVAILDFNSLYPSAIIEKNICQSVALSSKSPPHENHEIITTPTGLRLSKRREGILPKICRDLIATRKKIKKEMKEVQGSDRENDYHTLNAKQNAVKILTNAIYGNMGARTGPIPFPLGAATVTSEGRDIIQKVMEYIENNFPVTVIYGDTDSVFILHDKKLDENGKDLFAKEIEDACNNKSKIITGAFKIEHECTADITIMVNPKTYGMRLPKELKIKGIIKRDATKFTRETVSAMLDACLAHDKSSNEICEILCERIKNLVTGKIPLEDMRITKQINKELSSYKNASGPHLIAAEQMKNAGLDIRTGDRISFYYCDVATSSLAKKGESVVAEPLIKGHELKYEYYLEELMKKLKSAGVHLILNSEELYRLREVASLHKKTSSKFIQPNTSSVTVSRKTMTFGKLNAMKSSDIVKMALKE